MRARNSILLFLSFAVGCAAAQRPDALVSLDETLANQSRVALLEKLAPESINDARHYHTLAAKAFDDGEDTLLSHYTQLAQMSWDSAVEREKLEVATRRKKVATEEKQSSDAMKAKHVARKDEYEARVSRMEKILAMKGDEAKSAAEKKKLEMELAKAKEEHAKLVAAAQAQSSEMEKEKKKLGVLEERKALLDEASRVPTGTAKQESRGVVITLLELFAPGKATVLPTHEYVVNEIAKLAEKYPSYPIIVEGFTDSRGRAADNLALSTGRAQAVMSQLITAGKVDLNRIRSVGYGAERPVADNSKPDGRAKNRRIEVVFVFPD